MDEAFWAQKENPITAANEDDIVHGNYDANFFQDDGMPMPGGMDEDDLEFADAREHFSPGAEDQLGPEGVAGIADLLTGGALDSQRTEGEGAFGTQLVTQSRRVRPEYVQYARVAKKVDVRRLKEEIWRGLGITDTTSVSLLRGQESSL